MRSSIKRQRAFQKKTDEQLLKIIDIIAFETLFERQSSRYGGCYVRANIGLVIGAARAGRELLERYKDTAAEDIRFFVKLKEPARKD